MTHPIEDVARIRMSLRFMSAEQHPDDEEQHGAGDGEPYEVGPEVRVDGERVNLAVALGPSIREHAKSWGLTTVG